MCTGVILTAASLAASAVQMQMQMQQARRMEQRAAAQARAQYEASERNALAQYAEENRKIAEKALDTMDEQSDRVRAANEAMGPFMAADNNLSDGTFMSLVFEEAYGDSLNYIRLDRNAKREIASFESNKYAAEMNYINEVQMAQNQADNYMQEANARKTDAILGFVGSGLQIGTGYYQNKTLTDAIRGGPKPKKN